MNDVKYVIPFREVYSVEDVAEIFGVSESTVRSWIRERNVPHIRLESQGRPYVIPFYAVLSLVVFKILRLDYVPDFRKLFDFLDNYREFFSQRIFILKDDELIPVSPSILFDKTVFENAFLFEVVFPAVCSL